MTRIIILGAARSGTKFLREILGAASDTTFIPDGINSVWRMGNENHPDDALDANTLTGDSIAKIKQSIASLTNEDARFMVEKTCANTLRVRYVARVFPNARFVHIVRDGRAVVESAIRQWTAPGKSPGYYLRKFSRLPAKAKLSTLTTIAQRTVSKDQPATWGPVYPGMASDCETEGIPVVAARQWRECVRRCTTGLAGLPQGQVFTTSYEKFISDPGEVRAILSFTGQSEGNALAEFQQRARPELASEWKSVIDPAVAETVVAEAGDVLREWGYI